MFEPTTDFKGNWILGVIQMFKFSKSAVAEEFEKIEQNEIEVEDIESMLKIVRTKRRMRKKQWQKKQMMMMRKIGWANSKMLWAENLDIGEVDNMDIVDTVGMEQIGGKWEDILIVVICIETVGTAQIADTVGIIGIVEIACTAYYLKDKVGLLGRMHQIVAVAVGLLDIGY